MVNIIKTKIINIQDLKTPLMHTNRSLQKYYEMSGTTASTVGSQWWNNAENEDEYTEKM